MDQLLEQFFNFLNGKLPLSEALIYQLKLHIKHEVFQNKNTCLLKMGEASNKMYFIVEGAMRGEAEIVVNGQSRLQTTRIMMEKEIIFNVDSLLTGASSKEAIFTIEPLIALTITREEFYHIGSICPELYQLAWVLSQQSSSLVNKRLHELRPLDTEERVIWLMEHEPEWIKRVSDKYLASFIETTPENFSRIKRKLRDAGN